MGSREFREIQESCSTLPAAQVSECWYQEREAYDWSVANRRKFPKGKYPELNAKRISCWDVAKPGDVLRFTRYRIVSRRTKHMLKGSLRLYANLIQPVVPVADPRST